MNLKCFFNKKGFTLTEMLIAVAVLSLLGLVVIQVFLTASSLNHKAADTDRAVAASTAMVEQLKALPSNTALEFDTLAELFPDAQLVVSDGGERGAIRQHYSVEWQALPPGSPEAPGYILDAEFKAADSQEAHVILVSVKVVRQTRYFHKSDSKPLLFELEAALPGRSKGGAE